VRESRENGREGKRMSKLKAVTRAPEPLEKYIEPFDGLEGLVRTAPAFPASAAT